MPADHAQMLPQLEEHRDHLRSLAQLHMHAGLRRKLDPSDVVQQSLLKACAAIGDFRGNGNAELAAWLRRILANTLADAARAHLGGKRDLTLERSLEAAVEASSAWLQRLTDSSGGDRAARAEQIERLVVVLATLPDDQRCAIEMHYLQEQPVAEVAKSMGRTEASVAGLLRRALKALRQTLALKGES